MAKRTNSIYYELLWVIASLSLTFILLFLLTGKSPFLNEFDIYIHDTFYIVKAPIIISFLFLIINFILYAIKEAKNSFKRSLPNWILIITSVLLILMITMLKPIVTEYSVEQWNLNKTVFGASEAENKVETTQTNPIEFIFIGLQLVVLIITLFSVYHWGSHRKITVKEAPNSN